MIDHFEIKVSDPSKSTPFYAAVLQPLGIFVKWQETDAAGFYVRGDLKRTLFLLEKGSPVQNVHICFKAASLDEVCEFHRNGIEQGARDNGPPGLREHYGRNYYAAFLLDPDGNNIEALYRNGDF